MNLDHDTLLTDRRVFTQLRGKGIVGSIHENVSIRPKGKSIQMALPGTIDTSLLRQVRVTRRDGSTTTLYDVAEQVYAGSFRLAEQGAPAASAASAAQDGGVRSVTVTVDLDS